MNKHILGMLAAVLLLPSHANAQQLPIAEPAPAPQPLVMTAPLVTTAPVIATPEVTVVTNTEPVAIEMPWVNFFDDGTDYTPTYYVEWYEAYDSAFLGDTSNLMTASSGGTNGFVVAVQKKGKKKPKMPPAPTTVPPGAAAAPITCQITPMQPSGGRCRYTNCRDLNGSLVVGTTAGANGRVYGVGGTTSTALPAGRTSCVDPLIIN